MDLDAALRRLEREGIRVQDSLELRCCLKQYPHLVLVTIGYGRMILQEIPEARFLLSWYADPEIADEHPVLFVFLPGLDQETLERFEAVDNELAFLATTEIWFPVHVGWGGTMGEDEA